MRYLKTCLLAFLIFLSLSACSNNVGYFSNSIDLANQATRIANEGSAFELISRDDIRAMTNYYKQALKEAHKVDIEKLNQHYAGFGNHYRDEFIRGVKLFVEGFEQENSKKFLESQILLDHWGTWYSNNIDEIRKFMR